jgi:hypothetical protein
MEYKEISVIVTQKSLLIFDLNEAEELWSNIIVDKTLTK